MIVPAFFYAIRFRLAVWYAVTLAICLAVLGGSVYGVVRYRLVRHHDDALKQAADAVSRVLSLRDDLEPVTEAQQAAIDRIGHVVVFHAVDGGSLVLVKSSHQQNARHQGHDEEDGSEQLHPQWCAGVVAGVGCSSAGQPCASPLGRVIIQPA